MIHLRIQYGILFLTLLSRPVAAQVPGIYLKIGAQGLEAGGKGWAQPKGPEGNPSYGGDDIFPGDILEGCILNRVELGGEWSVSRDFGLRAGYAAVRILPYHFGWQQGFLDVLWTPWRRGHIRLYASAGLGLGSVSSTYVVREESWVLGQDDFQYQYIPGDYRLVSQSIRPFLRATAGIQLTRYFAVEINFDGVSLKSGKSDPWPSTVMSAGLNLVVRLPVD